MQLLSVKVVLWLAAWAALTAPSVEAARGGRLNRIANRLNITKGDVVRHFKAGRSPISRDALARLSGSKGDNIGLCSTAAIANLDTTTTIPDSYNVHEVYERCKPSILQQGSCGSCWAFATTGVVAQRMCIESEKIGKGYQLSPQALVSCHEQICYTQTGQQCSSSSSTCYCSLGCDGGYPDGTFRFMMDTGITPEVCVEYMSEDGTDPLQCSDVQAQISSCEATANTTVQADRCYYHGMNDIETIQRDIMQHGPVLATYAVYEDFYTISGGVYTEPNDGSDNVGYHAVIVVGWGTEDNIDYWLVQNSWGSDWGENGYFKIRRGTNECGIEERIVTTLVDTEGIAFSASSSAATVQPSLLNIALLATTALALCLSIHLHL